MDSLKGLPESIKRVQISLEPFIRSRQEASRRRRILAAHLSSRVFLETESLLFQPLSLIDAPIGVESSPSAVRGLRKDYIRSVRANNNALQEYDAVKRENRLQDTHEHSVIHAPQILGSSETSSELFLTVVKYRQKHERLRIFQDFIDTLGQKPVAAANYLDPKVALKDFESLPKVPEEVINPSGPRHDGERTDLKELAQQLEKSVLRAKLLLKKEQKFLAKIKVDHSGVSVSDRQEGKLQALGMARNELITWIETELANAGDNLDDSLRGESDDMMEPVAKNYIEAQLHLVQRQYSQYTQTRRTLISTATEKGGAPPTRTNDDTELPAKRKVPFSSNPMSHIIYPYLEELTSISNEQKFTIQQKSHLNTSLAKQLRESGQGLDRLGDESHLIPSYPLPSGSSHGKGSASFADVTSSSEKPNYSRRARAWVFASDSSTLATMEAVSEKLEEGKVSTSAAQMALSELHSLLGEHLREGKTSGQSSLESLITKDVWAQLDGQLGVIKTEE